MVTTALIWIDLKKTGRTVKQKYSWETHAYELYLLYMWQFIYIKHL